MAICVPLTDEEINAVIGDFTGGDSVVRTTLMSGGIYNTVCKLETKSGGRYVLRAGPVRRELLFGYERTMMSAEPGYERLLRAHGVPVAPILRYSPAGEVIGREYTLSLYLDAVPLSALPSGEPALPRLYREAGRLCAALHSIRAEELCGGHLFGHIHPGLPERFSSWRDFIRAFAFECADGLDGLTLGGDEYIAYLRSAADENAALLDAVTDSFMTHGDLWAPNILVARGDGEYKLAAVIDLDRTAFGDPLFEFAPGWIKDAAFYRGYGCELSLLGDDAKRRRRLYTAVNFAFMAVTAAREFGEYGDAASYLGRGRAAAGLR